MDRVRRLVHFISLLTVAPLVVGPLLKPATGREYGIGLTTKLRLLARMVRNTRSIPVLSHVFEHITMAKTILNVPRATPGCVVECGTYAGGSTANLSLVCELVGRRLAVFDSFAGLPDNAAEEESHILGVGSGHYHAGQFSATLETVRTNVARHGAIDTCDFHAGFFDHTMPAFDSLCVAVFIDVDLRRSAETCIRHLWPLLTPDGRFYTHEAQELHMAALFFDEPWWQRTLKTSAPGLAGAGNGLLPSAGGFGSELGYTVKPN